MFRLLSTLLVAALATAFLAPARADDKKDDKKDAKTLSGTWIREADGFDLSFKFEKEKLTLVVNTGDNGLTIGLTYKVDKDGKVTAEIQDVKEKGTFPTKPEKGTKISFVFKVDGKKAKLSDFDAHDAEGAKPIVEGEYKMKID